MSYRPAGEMIDKARARRGKPAAAVGPPCKPTTRPGVAAALSVAIGLFVAVGAAPAQTQNCQGCHSVHGGSLTNFPNHSNFGCNACHVPHNASVEDAAVPLWNPAHTQTDLTDHYASPTLDAQLSAPDGASKLCLSCHDGAWVHPGQRFGAGGGMGAMTVNHPISFVYDASLADTDAGLVDPTTLPSDILDSAGKLQCTSCHDVHAGVAQSESLLRWPYDSAIDGTSAAFCRRCHMK